MSQHGCPERLSNRSKGFQEDGPSQQTMEVLVETLTGTAFEMTVSPSDTIFAIKSKIFRVEGIPVSQQHLVYNLKELDDASSLRELAISDGARLRLVLGMRGGPISTRRLPPPPQAEPWREIESLLDSNRDDGEWSGTGGGGAGTGWKVTVLVFRDGERVHVARVRENRDGTYSPLDHNKYSSLSQLLSQECGGTVASGGPGVPAGAPGGHPGAPGSLHDNKVTMNKMLDLRRRMENLSVHRRRPDNTDKADIQKTRSEETLSISSLDEPDATSPYECAAGEYTRYTCPCPCPLADRYTLLPPIPTRPDHSVRDTVPDSERLKVPESVAGLVEPGLGVGVGVGVGVGLGVGGAGGEEPRRPPRARAPLPPADYGPLVCGSGSPPWGGAGLAGAVSASSLLARPGPACPPRRAHAHSHTHSHSHTRPKLSDALFSSSTSDLDNLKRNSRILPALSRHRNRSHLHLSDEALHSRVPAPPRPAPARPAPPRPAPARPAPPRCGVCRKRLGAATEHRCRCGASYCAPHRYKEVHHCHYDYKASADPSTTTTKLPEI